MSVCPIFPAGPLVPNGSCFLDSNNIDHAVAGFKKCCGSAPVAQAYNKGAHVCLIYCPIVEDGPSGSDLQKCLVSEIGTAACMAPGQLATPDDVSRASDLAKTTGLCSACLSQTTTAVVQSTTDSEGSVSETASGTTAENTTERTLSTATITTAPTRTGNSITTKATTSATSTNAAIGMYKEDTVPWKVGFTMGAMLFTGAIAGLLM